MDTKLTSRIHSKFKKYFNKLYILELLLIIILITTIIPSAVNSMKYLPYKVTLNDIISNTENFKLERLKEDSESITDLIYTDTDGLKKLEDAYIKKKFITNILSNPKYISPRVGFIIINNKTKESFTNREWLDNRIKSGEDGIKVIESLCKQENVKYYIADNVNNFNHFVEDNSKYRMYYDESINKSVDKKVLSNYTEVYFRRGEDYDSEITHIKINIMRTVISILVFVLLIIKWFIYYIKNKRGSLKRAIKEDYIYIKMMKLLRCIKRIPIVIKRIQIIPLDIIVTIGWFIYVFFIYSTYREGRIERILGWGISEQFATFILGVYFIMRFFYNIITKYDETEKIIEDLDKIKSGDMDLLFNTPKSKQLKALIDGINEIKEGYKNSIEEGIKNEKLKAELISNVSHDLRTPLTSIINYVDILKRNDITEEERSDYIKVLENKSSKLKKLIDDLFEISKMNSGKIELNRDEVDIIQLLYQSIGEMDDDKRSLNFNIEAPESIIMEVDGYRMSRVFQNIVSNSLKYSLDNTRVYIKVQETKTRVTISFKNVANYEMTFKEDEVLERFARGDKSRNSEIEGSGLGLAIAKSIVELHGGKIKVEREGDMFKVYIIIPKNN